MSKVISLSGYAPSIGSEEKAAEILHNIQTVLKSDNIVVDFENVQTMGTNCAKLIFGTLYKSMDAEKFYERINFIHTTPNIRRTIRLGIEFALASGKA